jgi:hypothetical protein
MNYKARFDMWKLYNFGSSKVFQNEEELLGKNGSRLSIDKNT